MKCDVNTETHFYTEALIWAAVRYRERGSPKRMSRFHYAVQNSSQVTSILLTINFYSLFIQLFIVATTYNMDINAMIEFFPDAYQHMKIHWVDRCCYSKLNFLSLKTLLSNGHWLIPWQCSRTEAMRHEIGSFLLKIPIHFNKAVIKFMF